MTCQELLDAAVRLVCEDPSLPQNLEDYTERAPYLLASCLTQCAPLDARYRLAHGLDAVEAFEGAAIDLGEAFPLCGIFAPAAVYYLAAMLVIDENERMSDKYFSLYSDALASIQVELPATATHITDRYGLI
ncbi:MAG: hypothetical protein IJW92_05995 [Clostridia bacterium]|nr:hypothetical protein [Clostridia bacterium]